MVTFFLMSITSWNLCLLRAVFPLGDRKMKLVGIKSHEKGGWQVSTALLFARKCFTAVCLCETVCTKLNTDLPISHIFMKNVINHPTVDVKLIIYQLQGHLNFYGHQFIANSVSGFGAVDGCPIVFLFMALRRYRRGIPFVFFKPFKDIVQNIALFP